MKIELWEAEEIIDQHIKDQGCEGDDLEGIKLMQGHIYDWIVFFGLEEKYAKSQNTAPKGDEDE